MIRLCEGRVSLSLLLAAKIWRENGLHHVTFADFAAVYLGWTASYTLSWQAWLWEEEQEQEQEQVHGGVWGRKQGQLLLVLL
jgi:hypothetical protein